MIREFTVKRSTAGIMCICFGIFVLVLSIVGFTVADDALIAFPIFCLIFSLIFFCGGIYHLVKSAQINKEYRAYANAKLLNAEMLKVKKDLVDDFHQLSISYMLGIDYCDLKDAIMNGNIEDALAIFNGMIPPDAPTVEDFCGNLAEKCGVIVEEIHLSKEKFEAITLYVLQIVDEMDATFTDEHIAQTAAEFAKYIPKELSNLHNKVNYDLAALGFIMSYAQEMHDDYIAIKVNEIRKKRGYIE